MKLLVSALFLVGCARSPERAPPASDEPLPQAPVDLARIVALDALDDGAVIVLRHPEGGSSVARVDGGGAVRWSAPLPTRDLCDAVVRCVAVVGDSVLVPFGDQDGLVVATHALDTGALREHRDTAALQARRVPGALPRYGAMIEPRGAESARLVIIDVVASKVAWHMEGAHLERDVLARAGVHWLWWRSEDRALLAIDGTTGALVAAAHVDPVGAALVTPAASTRAIWFATDAETPVDAPAITALAPATLHPLIASGAISVQHALGDYSNRIVR